MILYKLGIVSDALSISDGEIALVFMISSIFAALAIFTAANVSDFVYVDNIIEEFLQDHKLLTTMLLLVFSAVAAFSLFLSTEAASVTATNTIVKSQYILKNSTRTVEVKDDFKTVYENDQDVSFSSQIDNDFYEKLPEDLKNEIKNHVHFSFSEFKSSHDKDVVLFSTDRDSTLVRIDVLKAFSKHKQVIKIDADKDGTYVPILATIDSIELTKEEENEENLTYHIDKIEMANAVETISRDSQSKSRDIKSIRLHISGKTSKAAKAKKSIEKLVE